MSVLERFEARFKTDRTLDFAPGDTVRVHVRVIEGEKERSQIFHGVVTSVRQAAAAPRSRVVHFTLADGSDRRLFHTLYPARFGVPQDAGP